MGAAWLEARGQDRAIALRDRAMQRWVNLLQSRARSEGVEKAPDRNLAWGAAAEGLRRFVRSPGVAVALLRRTPSKMETGSYCGRTLQSPATIGARFHHPEYTFELTFSTASE
jgi:hypothetical protein